MLESNYCTYVVPLVSNLSLEMCSFVTLTTNCHSCSVHGIAHTHTHRSHCCGNVCLNNDSKSQRIIPIAPMRDSKSQRIIPIALMHDSKSQRIIPIAPMRDSKSHRHTWWVECM